MTFEIFYGQFPVKTIYVKVAWGAFKIGTWSHMHLVTFDPDNTYISNEGISLLNKKRSF